jgi:DNA-binding response OmpR family regulator
MRTVILDDEAPIVELLSRACAREGHEVQAFTSSADALVYLTTNAVDLLITDMNMPGPDGPAVIREARRLQPDVFTLMITGHAGDYPLDEILSTGTADVMFKPFHMNEFRARLALADRRRQLVTQLHKQRQALQVTSNAMIHGLQSEVEELRSSKRGTLLTR